MTNSKNILREYRTILEYIKEFNGDIELNDLISRLESYRIPAEKRIQKLVELEFIGLIIREEVLIAVLKEKGYIFLKKYAFIQNFSYSFGLV